MSTPPSHYICRICNIPGHWIQKCPLKNQNQVPSYYICKICKKPGHFIHNCPLKYDPTLSRVPSNYICHKCGYPGHWIQNCPNRYNNYNQSIHNDRKKSNIPPVNYVGNQCGKPGHWIKDCTQQYSTTPPTNYLCRICKVPGHWIQQCPDKASTPNKTPQHSSQVVTGFIIKSDLINGYIRRIENIFQQNLSSYTIIPSCINQIINAFYLWSIGSYLATNDENKDAKWHRIYYEANHPTNKHPIITMKISEISDESYTMKHVIKNNPKLFCVDINIPWSDQRGLKVAFYDRDEVITTTALFHNCHGMIHITTLPVSSMTFAEIVRHSLDDIDPYDPWNSYCYLKLVFKNLPCDTAEFGKIWCDKYAELIKEPKLQNVHKMQLLKSVDPTICRNTQCLFYIVRGYVMQTDNPLLQYANSRDCIGIDIYDSFHRDFLQITNTSGPLLIDSGDGFCIAICLNFFRYFQDVKRKYMECSYGPMDIIFSDFNIMRSGFAFCRQYHPWVDSHLMDLLEVDLRISKLRPRQYCVEHFALRFCRAMKENQMDGTTKMFEIFMRMKALKLLNVFMNQILKSKDLMQCILYLLGDEKINHMFVWTRFRALVDEQYVSAIMDGGKFCTVSRSERYI